MKDIIKQIKFFGPYDFKNEERYLNEMSQNGYEFIEKFLFTYKFKKTDTIDQTFKIDYRNFSNNSREHLTYYNFLSELGLTLIDNSFRRHYFKVINDTNSKMFLDKKSELDLLKKILKDYIPASVFTFSCIFITPSLFWSMLFGFFALSSLVYVFNTLKNISRLKKEIY